MANKNGWITKPLGECLNFIIDHRGKTPKKLGSDWVGQGVPTISAKNINGGKLVAGDAIRHVTDDVYRRWMNTGDVKRGDCFLVSEGATLGECMYWDEDYLIVLGQRLFCLRANPNVLYPRFLYFYMTSYSFQSEVIARSTGTSVAGLRQTEVMKLQVRLPSLEEQRSIGDTLYNLNKHIELNRRMNETLEAMARAIFKSWFVDFDPVRAKCGTGILPVKRSIHGQDGRATLPVLPKPIANLFPNSFEDSELGKIPKGWEVGRLDDVLTLQRGFDLPTADRTHGKYPVVAASGPNGCHDRFMVRGPGVTTGRSGVLGKVFFIHEDFWPLNTSLWVKEFTRPISARKPPVPC